MTSVQDNISATIETRTDILGFQDIQGRVKHCQALFENHFPQASVDVYDWIKTRQGEFNLWVAGLRAAEHGKSSLDYRVRDHPDLFNMICHLLEGLIEALEGYAITDSSTLETETPTSDADFNLEDDDSISLFSVFSSHESDPMLGVGIEDSKNSISESKFYIQLIIKQLTRVSTAIIRSGHKLRYKKADEVLILDKEDVNAFKAELALVICRGNGSIKDKGLNETFLVRAGLVEHFKLTQVQKRLINANITRRNRIMYATRNSRDTKVKEKILVQNPKLGLWEQKISVMGGKTAHSSYLVGNPPKEILEPPPLTKTQKGCIKPGSVENTATDLGSQFVIEHIKKTSDPTPSTMTGITKTCENQEYPNCPRPQSGNLVQCPYCAELLDKSYWKHKARWRGHVAHHILPYSCIYEDCKSPDTMFQTYTEFQQHILADHAISEWVCIPCTSSPARDDSFIFKTRDDWQSHMTANHEAFSSTRLQLFEKSSHRTTIAGPLLCPLCQYVGEDPLYTLENHIARCLHGFALRCLPWGTGNQDDSTSEKTASGSSSVNKFSTDDEEGLEKVDINSAWEKSVINLSEHLLWLETELNKFEVSPLDARAGMSVTDMNDIFFDHVKKSNVSLDDRKAMRYKWNQRMGQESQPIRREEISKLMKMSIEERIHMWYNPTPNTTSLLFSDFPRSEDRLIEIYTVQINKIISLVESGLQIAQFDQERWDLLGYELSILETALSEEKAFLRREKSISSANLAHQHVAEFHTLQEAVRRGDIRGINSLLAAGAYVNHDDLQAAARGGNLEVVERLLVAGADATRGDALQAAAIWGYLDVIKRLLAAGAPADSGALRTAADRGHLEVVKILLEAKADPTTGGALRAAAEGGHSEVVKILLAAGANASNSILRVAADRGHLEVVERLLAAGADATRGDIVQEAARWGHLEVLERLLAAGADANGGALQAAADRGYLEIIDRLLAAGADANSGIQVAADRGYQEVVDRLLAAGADANGGALQAAAGRGHLEIVDRLLVAGVDATIIDDALWAAATRGHPEVVKRLLIAGANASRDALQAAARGGHLEVVERLLAAGANANNDALQAAATWGYLDVIERLLVAGADANSGSLCAAADRGHVEVVERLLAAGANANSGALRAAADRGYLEIIDRLLAAGADANSDAIGVAADRGHLDVIERLLAAGADATRGDILQEAARWGHLEVVERLLAAGADAATSGALQAAASGGHLEVTERLLAAGADPTSGDALRAAADGGHPEVVKRLLAAGAHQVSPHLGEL